MICTEYQRKYIHVDYFWLLFMCHCSARCFRAECAEIPRVSRVKLHEMQFLFIAKRVAVNEVNSNYFCILADISALQLKQKRVVRIFIMTY